MCTLPARCPSTHAVLTDSLLIHACAPQDAHPICRSAACWCLGQWSQHLKPHILTCVLALRRWPGQVAFTSHALHAHVVVCATCSHHADILPAVFAALHDGDDEVQNTGCFVLESFCECVTGPAAMCAALRAATGADARTLSLWLLLLLLGYGWDRNLEPENVCKYLDNLMAHLGRLITSPNVNVREMAVSAIGSVVIGSQHHFAKYAPSPLCTRTPCDGVSRTVALCAPPQILRGYHGGDAQLHAAP